MTMYELTGEFRLLQELADDPDTDAEVFRDTLEGLLGEIEEKANGYACVIRNIEADSAALDAEIKRLQELKRSRAAKVDAMKAVLKEAMIATGKTKFSTPLFSFAVAKNPPSVVLDEQYIENIPEEYLIPQEPKVDKAKLKDDLKAGKDLEGIAHLEQGTSVRIK